jgi:dihydrofolate reductase
MRKLVVQAFVTLDGIMQAPGGQEEDPTGGFRFGGWSVSYWNEAMLQRMGELMAKPFDLLLGRRTYEIFAAHWPYIEDDPMGDALNRAVKHVASRTLTRLDWSNSRLIPGDVGAGVATIKEEPGAEIQVHGSSNLVQTLLAHDLVDELRIWTFPLLLGEGKRLFGGGTIPLSFELRESTPFDSGVVLTTLARSSAVAPAELADSEVMSRFALDEPTEAEKARRDGLARGT